LFLQNRHAAVWLLTTTRLKSLFRSLSSMTLLPSKLRLPLRNLPLLVGL
jgi:hypothetical protein